MKKILVMVFALCLVFGLAACTSNKQDDTKLVILDSAYANEDYAICVAKENTALLDKINTALDELKADGTVQSIIDKYISSESPADTTAADTTAADTTAVDTTAVDTTPADTTAADTTTADAKVLVMATNAAFPPYEYYQDDKIVGIDAEIAQAIADKLGMELQIQDMEFGSIIAAVQTGKVDMGMAGMTVTPDREESVNFSSTYATGVQVVIVKEGSPITSVDDLSADGASYKIGVQQDTTGDIYATDDFGEDRVMRYNKGSDAILALKAGKVDCVIIDNEPCKSICSCTIISTNLQERPSAAPALSISSFY